MNNIISITGIMFMLMSLTMTGKLFLSLAEIGYELQPLWVKGSGVVAFLVMLVRLVKIDEGIISIAFNQKMQIALCSIFIIPLYVGIVIYFLNDFDLTTVSASTLFITSEITQDVDKILVFILTYLPLPLNCWYIYLDFIKPLFSKCYSHS